MSEVGSKTLLEQERGHPLTRMHDKGLNLQAIGPFLERHERWLLASILTVAVLVQLSLAPFHGFFVDMQYYTKWGQYLLAHPSTFYAVTKSNYPPLMMYIFAGVDLTYGWLAHLFGLAPMYTVLDPYQAPTYSFMWLWAKIVIIFCNTGSAFLIYRLVRSSTSARWALLATLAYALAPTMLFEGALWGQTDGVPIFYLLLTIVAVRDQRFGWAGVSLGIMLMLKLQPAIFIPVLLVYIYAVYGWQSLAKLLLTFAATVVVICLPMAFPFPPQVFALLSNTQIRVNMDQPNGYNLWYLFNPSLSAHAHLIGPLSATKIGYILFAPIMLLSLALVWFRHSFTSLYLALALVAVGFFAVTTFQHERYMVQSLALLLLASAGYRPCIRIFVAASFTTFYNIIAAALPTAPPQGVIGSATAFVVSLPSGLTTLACWFTLELTAALILMCIWYLRYGPTYTASPKPEDSTEALAPAVAGIIDTP